MVSWLTLALALLILTNTGIVGSITLRTNNRYGSFNLVIKGQMESYDMPSFSGCVVQNNSIAWCDAYGDQPSVDLVYPVGSVSKTVTATGAMILRDRGLLSLDDPINDYLPINISHPLYPNDTITIQMLLSHSAGLNPDTTLADQLTIPGIFTNPPTTTYPEWLWEYLTPGGKYYGEDVWSTDRPGSGFHYGNIHFSILGYIMESITNQSLEEFIKETLFDPLGMIKSSYLVSSYQMKELAVLYRSSLTSYVNYQVTAPAGVGLRSSAPDLTKFMLLHMNNGSFNDQQLVSQDSIALMHNDYGSGYGLGWQKRSNYQGHAGAAPGTQVSMFFNKNGAVGLTNINTLGFDNLYTTLYHHSGRFPVFIETPPHSTINLKDEDKELTWIAQDLDPKEYFVTRNGTEVMYGEWKSGTPITVKVSDIGVGTFQLELHIVDAEGHENMDQLVVTVESEAGSSQPNSTPDTTHSGEVTTTTFALEGFLIIGIPIVLSRRQNRRTDS